MSQSLQLHSDTMAEWQVMRQQAETLIKTQFLPRDIKTADQALAIVLMGRELGIGIMQSFNNINVISGKPTISPQLMLALINRTGELEDLVIEDDGHVCRVKMVRKGRSPHVERFSMDDAVRMKATEYINGDKRTIPLAQKYNWQQMPAVMRKWRAVAACARIVFPDVILGMYTPEEMGAECEPETGEVVEAEPVEQEIADPRPKTLGELATPKQLWMIRSIGKEQNLDVDSLCRNKFNCAVEEISKKAASAFIEDLKVGPTAQAPAESDRVLTEAEQAAADRIKQAKENLRTVTIDTGPSKSLMKNRKHSAEIARRFDAVVVRLVGRGVEADELLRETNSALHDSGMKQVRSRYELDDAGAAMVCELFEKWADVLDRKAQESRVS